MSPLHFCTLRTVGAWRDWKLRYHPKLGSLIGRTLWEVNKKQAIVQSKVNKGYELRAHRRGRAWLWLWSSASHTHPRDPAIILGALI